MAGDMSYGASHGLVSVYTYAVYTYLHVHQCFVLVYSFVYIHFES